MEKLNLDEELKLKELLAKKKRIERAEKRENAFFEEADKRKEELLNRWG